MNGQKRSLLISAILVLLLCGQVVQAGFITLSLTAGNGNTTASHDEVTFNAVGSFVIDHLTGTGTVEAGTAGGWVYFGGLGLPVFFPPDGMSYIVSGPAPTALTSGLGNLSTSLLQAGGTIPPTSTRLSVAVSADHLLNAVVSDGDGHTIGNAAVTVPSGGWWVIGLGPGHMSDPLPVPFPDNPVHSIPPTTTSTPEPSTLVIAVLGIVTADSWRGRRRNAGFSGQVVVTLSRRQRAAERSGSRGG